MKFMLKLLLSCLLFFTLIFPQLYILLPQNMTHPNKPVLYNSLKHGSNKEQYYSRMIGAFIYKNPDMNKNDKLTVWMRAIPHKYSESSLPKIFTSAHRYRLQLMENDPQNYITSQHW